MEKRLSVRIELVDAAKHDYANLDADLEQHGFLHLQSPAASPIAHYTFAGEANMEAVAKLAQQSALKTSRHFFIFVSDLNDDKGLVIAG